MLTFKVLGALLSYPESDLRDALGELEQVLDKERLLGRDERKALDGLFAHFRRGELLDLQEHYVDLFDRVRSLSLHLFEHVHGESRDRGQAMVDLKSRYAARGLNLVSNELPDYLPAFLEYLSLLPRGETREALADCAHILGAIGSRLAKRRSPYSAVFQALLVLAGEKVSWTPVTDAEIREEDDPATLDKLWQEEPAFGSKAQQPQVSVIHFHGRAVS